jgi:hypothetical protein
VAPFRGLTGLLSAGHRISRQRGPRKASPQRRYRVFTDVDTDVRKYCSQLWEERGDSAVYALGLAFSGYGTSLLLEPVDGD